MRSISANRFWILLFSILALAALMGLAISLREISFRGGQAFGGNEPRVERVSPVAVMDAILSIPFRTQLFVWVLFILLFVFIGMLLSPEMRKRLIKIAIRVAITYWGLWILFTRFREVLEKIGFNLAPLGETPSVESNGAPGPEFAPPESSSWLAYLVSFCLAVLILLAVWKLSSIWKEFNAPPSAVPMEKIGRIASSSLRELSSGRDSTDVIIGCYRRMSDVIFETKRIGRIASMTPSEFAVLLEQSGLPADAVRGLTRLFESVRYGDRRSDSAVVDEAVSCLTTIVHFCGEPV